MTINNLEICSYEKWYPHFSAFTTESVVVSIPEDVLEYMRADKLVLPKEAVFVKDQSSTENSHWDECDEETPELMQPSFPEFSKQLKDAVQKLGGSVFVKLNWSAPTDAAWITADKTLKCTNLEDIYLLLKSSELIARDLSHTFKGAESTHGNFCVVLKRWQDIHPGSEYRCFVMQKELVGISQRDSKAFYKHIGESKFDIIEDVKKFYQERVKEHFSLTSYVFDIIRVTKDKVSLVDFSPLDRKLTKPILFTWEELRELSNNRTDGHSRPEFRFLGEEPGYQPNYCGVPQDVLDLCARRSPLSLIDYVTLKVQTQSRGQEDSSESDEETEIQRLRED